MAPSRPRVLFLCTGNAARSQMAEALLRGQRAFDAVATELVTRIQLWLSLPAVRSRIHGNAGSVAT